MAKHAGGVAEYRSSEGKHVRVAYKGPVAHTVLDVLGGIRSTCTCARSLCNPRCAFLPVHPLSRAVWGNAKRVSTVVVESMLNLGAYADVGAAELRELSKRTTFIRVTQQLNEVFGSSKEALPQPKL